MDEASGAGVVTGELPMGCVWGYSYFHLYAARIAAWSRRVRSHSIGRIVAEADTKQGGQHMKVPAALGRLV
jgi:hypothetical protein